MAAVSPTPESFLRVPNLDFGSMNFLAPMPAWISPHDIGDPTAYLYNGPSQATLEISNAVLAGGEILQMNPPAPNASWTIDFVGPSIKCDNVPTAMHQRLRRNIADGLNASEAALVYGYLAWFPDFGWLGDDLIDTLPFMAEAANGSLEFQAGSVSGLVDSDHISLYLAALPSVFGATTEMVAHEFGVSSNWSSNADIPDWLDGTIVQCILYNSTYHVDLDYVNGEQTIAFNVTTQNMANGSLGSTLIGPSPRNASDPCGPNSILREDQKAVCYNNRNALQALSYVAIMIL